VCPTRELPFAAMVPLVLCLIFGTTAAHAGHSSASMLYFPQLECNAMDCAPGLTLSAHELEGKISAALEFCADPKTSTALSPNQCEAVFDFAFSMVKDTGNGGKCITDDVFSKLSVLVTAMAVPKKLPKLKGELRKLPAPPLGTLAEEIIATYGDHENRGLLYKQLLSDARKDKSVNPFSSNNEKRFMAKTEPGSVSDEYAALVAGQGRNESPLSTRASNTQRFFSLLTKPSDGCNCPSSFPGTTWYPECCSVVCGTYGEPKYFSVQFAYCCSTHKARLGEKWESYCWYYPSSETRKEDKESDKSD